VKEGNIPVWAVLVMFGLGAIAFVTDRAAENRAGDRVRVAVANASTIRVNGEEVADPRVLVGTLRLVEHVPAHHSHPTAPVRIDLVNGSGSTAVVIARDSQRPTEFWTFLPEMRRQSNGLGQPAGRITSSDLDNFLRQRGL
jgi:hypothetical protein